MCDLHYKHLWSCKVIEITELYIFVIFVFEE